MRKSLKNLFTILLCGIVFVSTNIVVTYAEEGETFEVGSYEYTIYENSNFRTVEVYDVESDIQNIVVYNKLLDQLSIDGVIQQFSYQMEYNPILNPKEMSTYSTYTRYGPYNTTFEAVFQSIGLLAGTILAISRMATVSALVGISPSLFATGIETIYDSYDDAMDVTEFVGQVVNGTFTYYQDLHNSNGTARYANRTVKYKFPTLSYKSYSFGNGSWWSTSRPDY